MSVSEKDVRHIASLARLAIPAKRIPTLVDELNHILIHMDVLQRADLSALDENTPAVAGMPLRPDVPGSVPLERRREDFAPQMRDGFFLVPRLDTHGTSGSSADEDAS
ncbi:MAG: Asp-tRNA(Asn)/Glu-tRNA(Gln) amidotransferase subunit GatC [Gemmatimonadaceae bacterium]